MKKDYLLAAILCLITMAATAQQTEQVQIPNIPFYAPKWLYDTNGDGKLEFIYPETKYVSNDKYNHSLKTYSRSGTEISSYTFPFTLRIDNIENNFIGLGNYVGDENIDMFFKGVYYSIYDTYLFTGNTGGTFTESIIKKPAYVDTDYESTEWEMPAITLDADGDGRPDLYGYNSNTKQHYFMLQQPDGTFMRKTIRVLTDEEEIDNAIIDKDDAPIVAATPIRFSGVSLAKVIRKQLMKDGAQKAPQAAMAEIAWSKDITTIDLNMDGYPDLIDNQNGGALISIDEGVYYFGTFKGIPTARDLNGDGILDYILFDSKTKTVTLQIYTGAGGFREQTLMQNMNISNVYCYDFDGDGDVDILLPFDYTESSQYAFLVFFQNNGDNTFTKKERSLSDKLYFKGCIDVDNDGIYEVIAFHENDNQNLLNHKLFRIKCKAGWNVVKDAEPFVEYVKSSNFYGGAIYPERWVAADMENSGKINFYTIQHKDYTDFKLYGTFDAVKTNNPPARMAVPTFIADAAAQVLRIEWKPGSDDLTAVPDLTYALRIGTEPGKGDILYAYANADGSRRRTGAGNCSSALFRLMRTGGWSAGNYYIAVQAVDAHGRGGAWSSEAVYSHTQLSSQFNMGYTQTTTADTLSLTLKTPKKESYQYNWNMGEGGEIVSESNGTWKVVYNTAGRKTISLQVTDGAGNKSGLTEKQLEVYAVKFEENKLGLNYQNDSQFFDADMNGKLDLVSGTAYNNPNYNIFGILEGNGQGKFTKVGRTYNSDLKPSYIHFMDFNMDGLPDFVGETNKGNLFINGDDFDFEYSTKTFTANNTKGINLFENSVRFWQRVNNKEVQWIDLNNDGYPDMVSSMMYSSSDNRTGIYMNAGDNKNFTRLNLIEKLEYGYTLDLNKDGFYDIICSNSQNGKVVVYLNNGNSQFTKIQTPLVYFAQITDLPDLNNDGYPDFIKLDAEKKILYCYLGDKTYMYNSQPVEIKLPTDQWLSKDYSIYDVDNNGYPDIVFYVGILYFYPNMEIRWQDIAATHPGNLQSIPDNEGKSIYPFADLNGNGVPDAKSYDILSRIKNTAPQAPLNARAAQTDEGILLSWDAAVDAETPITQMRYNISVKEKGKSGTNSFIISPMNGLKDVAAAIPDYDGYRKSTQMIVPASRFQVGKTYQLQVQAIDLWNEHSPFSTVYEFTVESQVNIKMPQTACLGKRVNISYTGTETGVVTWHWDGGEAVAAGTNSWNVLWNTPGLKNVQVTVGGKTVDRPLKVRKNVDMAFSLPTTVLAKCEIPFTLPDLFNDPTKKVYIRTSDNMQVVTAENVSGMNVIAPSDVNKITVKRRAGSLDAVVIFPKNATQWIELVYNDESCGELYRQTTDVVGQNLTPQIALVTVDAGTGKTKINWTTPTDLDISIFNKIEIYKEMGSTNNFVKIDEVPLTAEMYIDQSSDPLVRKSRYRIALGTTFGGRSQMSETHCNVHVMINKGLGNAINLIWTKYEGALINSYSILRGTSPENMQIITTASGYENSFTDINAPEDAYYALSYSSSYSDKWISLEQQAMSPQYIKGTTANTISGSSNTVTTNQSVAVTFAQSLFIQSIEKNIQLTPDQPVLHLYAEILPAMATYKRVNWKITEGADLAIISESGLLTYIGRGSNGTITVKATAIDGSGISAQRTITVGGFVQTSIEEAAEAHAARNYTLYPNPAKDELRIENGEIQINRLEILDLSGKVVCQYDDSKNKINISALSRGIYFVKIETDNGVVTRKFIKE